MRTKGGARGKISLGRDLRVGLLGCARPTSPRPLECSHKAPLPCSAQGDQVLLQGGSLSPKEHKKVQQHLLTVLQETDPKARKG